MSVRLASRASSSRRPVRGREVDDLHDLRAEGTREFRRSADRVLARPDTVLPAIDRSLAGLLLDELARHEVEIRTGLEVTATARDDGSLAVRTPGDQGVVSGSAILTIDLMKRRRLLLVAGGALVAACGGAGQGRPEDALVQLYANPAKDEWPDEFRQLPAETQEMYRYAAANRATLQYIPCFCGCVNGGHGSNFDCYVREVYADGRIRLDTMSFG